MVVAAEDTIAVAEVDSTVAVAAVEAVEIAMAMIAAATTEEDIKIVIAVVIEMTAVVTEETPTKETTDSIPAVGRQSLKTIAKRTALQSFFCVLMLWFVMPSPKNLQIFIETPNLAYRCRQSVANC